MTSRAFRASVLATFIVFDREHSRRRDANLPPLDFRAPSDAAAQDRFGRCRSGRSQALRQVMARRANTSPILLAEAGAS